MSSVLPGTWDEMLGHSAGKGCSLFCALHMATHQKASIEFLSVPRRGALAFPCCLFLSHRLYFYPILLLMSKEFDNMINQILFKFLSTRVQPRKKNPVKIHNVPRILCNG